MNRGLPSTSDSNSRDLGAAFVLGNHAALQDVDLDVFSGMATVGTDAGFRHWGRVGWYPTHYCCLDDELIATDHDSIRSLVDDGLVESAFVTARILEFHPELADDARWDFFDSFKKGWHERRGRMLGLPFTPHPAFESSTPMRMTTGAYAARYAAFRGHRSIFLVGIACEAATEQEEDAGARLALRSIEVFRDDIVEQGLPVEIRNCSKASLLASEGALPYEDLDHALGRPLLGAVAVPMTFREEDAFIANLELWDDPARLPRFPEDDGYSVPLVLVLNGERDQEFEARIREAFDRCRWLAAGFSSVEFRYCRLTEEEDRYERRSGGVKAGPNNQFLKGMRLLRGLGRYAFMMETDCLPVRPGWLSELERIVEAGEPFWVLGSLYRGVGGGLAPRWREHINGNAVYAVGDPTFQDFLDQVWQPALEEFGQEYPGLPYDCVPSLYFRQGGVAPEGERWTLYQRVAHQFRFTEFIQNHSGAAEIARRDSRSIAEIRRQSPRTYIVHGRHLFPERTAAPRAESRSGEAGGSPPTDADRSISARIEDLARAEPIVRRRLEAGIENLARIDGIDLGGAKPPDNGTSRGGPVANGGDLYPSDAPAPSTFEGIAIHQMGKVGSASLVKALGTLGRPAFHTHVLNPERNPTLLDPALPPVTPPWHLEVPPHVFKARELRRQFIDRGLPLAVITAIREPIARNVSAFFQNLEGFIAEYGADPNDPDGLFELFRRSFPHYEPQEWIDRELNEVFGIDVFANPFPKRGWVEVDADPHRILVMRTTLPDEQKADLVMAFLGVQGLTIPRMNVTEKKVEQSGRTRVLADFKRLVAQDHGYIDEMLRLRMATHFFSAEERRSIREGWLELGASEPMVSGQE